MLCQGGRAQQEAKKEEIVNIQITTVDGVTRRHTDVNATMDFIEKSIVAHQTINFMGRGGKQQMYITRNIVFVEEV